MHSLPICSDKHCIGDNYMVVFAIRSHLMASIWVMIPHGVYVVFFIALSKCGYGLNIMTSQRATRPDYPWRVVSIA